MLQSRAARIWVAAAVLLVLLLGAWVAWQVWKVNKDLNAAVDHAKAIQAGVDDGDTDVVQRELPALRKASASAADRTSGITWKALTKLPFFGDDAEGVQVTSDVLDGLARDGFAPLAEATTSLDEMLPHDGAIDVDTVKRLQAPVANADKAFAQANKRLAGVDDSGFVSKLDSQFTDFRRQVRRASSAMDAAHTATDLLPDMLGAEGQRNYLLVFQNNAEIRSTGGLAGAASLIKADHGDLQITKHVAGADFGEAPKPVLPLTKAEKDLYGDVLGTYFLNAGMTPDVPRAADLLRARFEQVYPKQRVDGVVMIDTIALSYILEATGPITVDGIHITSENLVDELLHKVYERLGPDAQDKFFAEVSRTAFDKVTDGIESPGQLIRALTRAADQRRLFVHTFDEDEQAKLAGSAIAGEFVTDPEVEKPQIAVTVNDTTGSKMSYYLRYDVQVQATSCVKGVQTFSAKARLRSTAPPDAAKLNSYITGGGNYGIEPGHELVTFRMYGPAGGDIRDMRLNGQPSDLIRVDQSGRPVGMTYIDLKPGQTVDLAWTMKSGAGQTGAPVVRVTPSIVAGAPSPTEGACR